MENSFSMSRLVGPAALAILWIVAPAMPQETREPALRTEAETGFILGQMRLFLESTQATTSALATEDRATIAEQAAARGRRGAALLAIPAGLKAKETPAWSAMIGAMRKGFDDLAEAARDGAPTPKMIGLLGETLHNCVACHQSYRLVTE